MLTTFFAGVILTGVGAVMAYPRDLPTKDDLAASQALTQREIADVQSQISSTHSQLSCLSNTENEVTHTRIQVGKISYKLNIPDNE